MSVDGRSLRQGCTPLPRKRGPVDEVGPSTSKKRKCSPTLAEKVYRYQHETPPRFKHAPTPSSKKRPSLTRPEPFLLHTSERAEMSRRTAPKAEEYVPLCVQVAQVFTKTPPRCKRVPQPPDATPQPRVTVPQPFHISQGVQASHKSPPPGRSTPTPAFKAKPLSRRMLEQSGASGVPKVDKRPATVPVEFSFAGRPSLAAHPKPELDTPFKFKANPMPLTTPFKPVLPGRKLTPCPFHLATEGLSHRPQHTQTPQSVFKAKEWKAGEFPTPPAPRRQKPLTEIQAFAFASDTRASKRAKFDEELRQKEEARALALALREKENREREERDLRALRRSLVHKAVPIPDACRRPSAGGPTSRERDLVMQRLEAAPALPRTLR
uniref:TPX2 C-terminal domain-containing protein n=1 Tax=Eutreptiella gymnastica TaxID=73025 RepID=A0A7S1N3M5_9EUGL